MSDQYNNVRMPRACKKTRQQQQEQNQRKPRRSRGRATQQQEEHRYEAPTQVPPQSYSSPHTRSMANASTQGLYPNMAHVSQMNQPPTSYHTPTEQLPEHMAAPIPQQVTTRRYNTRRSAHNQASTNHQVPPMNNTSWNTNVQQPVTSYGHSAQQLPQAPTPVAHSEPPLMKSSETQSELRLKDADVKLLKKFRAQRMDISRIRTIIERGEHIVTYESESDDDDQDDDNLDDVEPDPLIATYAYICFRTRFQVSAAMAIENRPHSQQNPQPSTSSQPAPTASPSNSQSAQQQEQPPQSQSILENTSVPVPSTSSGITHQRESFPIPTISSQDLNNNNRFGPRFPHSPNGNHFGHNFHPAFLSENAVRTALLSYFQPGARPPLPPLHMPPPYGMPWYNPHFFPPGPRWPH